ncbi:hypothetical protein [Massilia consociata]|uniref:Lipoprotein n=1 Tax=Massilia consociata TaxID=760117 RepID=A0ABV6FKW6_9BURK
MKFSLIRPASVLALALGLASCGGGEDTYPIAGTVNGLVYPGLVLTANGNTLSVAPPAKAGEDVRFVFPKELKYGDEFRVTVTGQPAHQTCGIPRELERSSYGTGGELAQINAYIQCSINAYEIGGEITGLPGNTELVLANGSSGGTFTANPTVDGVIKYALPAVQYGVTYGVTVLKQPAGHFCTVQNPTGTMGDEPVTNINVTCVRT